MLRNQCVQEPEPPCSKTSGGPSPHRRQTICPSPQGVVRTSAWEHRRSTCSTGDDVSTGAAALTESLMVSALVFRCGCGWQTENAEEVKTYPASRTRRLAASALHRPLREGGGDPVRHSCRR